MLETTHLMSCIRMLTPKTVKLLIRILIIISENGKLPKRYESKTYDQR